MAATLLSEVREDCSVMKIVLRGPERHKLETNISNRKLLIVEGVFGSSASQVN